ncbi:MAG: methyltransferase domain-containing protein [Alphaproteobacteria bacterium]|nr:methyltransferase domain-containing protein [Alphaproteobacteria bacterium]MBV8549026.1 methyltransferase domain-containing protein [Alphaproteobacteria bacterium]
MQNPIISYLETHLGKDTWKELGQHLRYLAEDFWFDGPWNPLLQKRPATFDGPVATATVAAAASPTKTKTDTQAATKPKNTTSWHAQPGEISEKMWGEGEVAPLDLFLYDKLIIPLALNSNMSVLDMSAGLGGRMRRTTEELGVYFTGLEPDPEIAKRGMELSVRAGKGKKAPIEHYDPSHLKVSRTYDCVIARETFYRVPDQVACLQAIGKCTKPRAQIVFTDYILNPEDREKPAIKTWLSSEKGANPFSLIEMAEAWAKVGFNIRISEDLTDIYKAEIANGMKRLLVFLSQGAKPDEETKVALAKRIDTWNRRTAAMEQGMKFFRFYGTK